MMQDAHTDQLIFSVPALIAMISVAMSLEPGDRLNDLTAEVGTAQ